MRHSQLAVLQNVAHRIHIIGAFGQNGNGNSTRDFCQRRYDMKQEPVLRLAVTIAEAAQMTTLSQFTVRDEIKAGRLKATRVGRRVLIPVAELERFVKEGARADAED
jgi:excisionase family DNA binding protein